MSELQPIAFSPIEGTKGPHRVTNTNLEACGFEVIQFSPYNGNSADNLDAAREILDKTQGLVIDPVPFGSMDAPENVQEQEAALWDRIGIATIFGLPVFSPRSRESLLNDVARAHIASRTVSTNTPMKSASGVSVEIIISSAEIVPISHLRTGITRNKRRLKV